MALPPYKVSRLGRTSSSRAERVTATENPKSVECNSVPSPIVLDGRHLHLLRPRVSSDVVVPDEVDNCISRIAPACQVKVAVDDSKGSATYCVGDRCALGERGSNRVILPGIRLGAGNIASIVPTNQIDLTVSTVVTRSHKAAHVWHISTRAPCLRGDVIDSG